MKLKHIKRTFILQHDQSDCGVACLASLTKYYGGDASINQTKQFVRQQKSSIHVKKKKNSSKTYAIFRLSKIYLQTLKLFTMKTLDFNEMENVQGGDYCETLYGFMMGTLDYQGDWAWLHQVFYTNCGGVEPQ